MSTSKVFPKDKLGNPIKQGDLILLKLPDPEALFYVMGVSPASVIHDASGPVPVSGELEVVLKFKMQFGPDQNALHKAIVVKQPEVDESKVSLQ